MSQVYSQYALPAGTMVQEYRVIKTLGIGNFGIVYAAKNKYFSEIVGIPLENRAEFLVQYEIRNK